MSDPDDRPPGLRVLAVDDEPPALGELTYLLEQSEGVAEVIAASSAADALAALQSREVDAVFLDIRMPGIDGLALAGILTRFATPPPVVFVTAYDNHAVDAFEVAAVDYLLKPIRAERLALALTRVRAALESRRGAASEPGLVGSDGPAPEVAPEPRDETIAVELGGVTRYLRRSDVVYVEASRDYVRLCTRSGGHLVRVPLTSLEERWEPAGFVRVHRRYLVNSAFVEGLRSVAGRVSVDLGAGQAVPVSRRFTPEVRAALVQRHRLDREPQLPEGSPPPRTSPAGSPPLGSPPPGTPPLGSPPLASPPRAGSPPR
ncbi:MAG TPA: LytTR family DNA-binding domain-containing protein [Motilibacterales bacterium]|nr:LytTR family DNA-binding domain-containing protein [Motilibacterales bacterium]